MHAAFYEKYWDKEKEPFYAGVHGPEFLEKARKKIDEAGKSLDEAQDRNRIIQKKLRNIEEIDSSEADDYLGLTAKPDEE